MSNAQLQKSVVVRATKLLQTKCRFCVEGKSPAAVMPFEEYRRSSQCSTDSSSRTQHRKFSSVRRGSNNDQSFSALTTLHPIIEEDGVVDGHDDQEVPQHSLLAFSDDGEKNTGSWIMESTVPSPSSEEGTSSDPSPRDSIKIQATYVLKL